MALVKVKPTSAGRRGMVKVVSPNLHKGEPYAPLLEKKTRGSGRNNNGHITIRHRGGGHKQHYRVVDFRRDKDGIPAKVERLEYDPNRTAHIALLCYADGERRYIIAPRGLEVGATLISGIEAPIRAGNTLPIRNIPVGTTIHCVEMLPGKGAQMVVCCLSDPNYFRILATTPAPTVRPPSRMAKRRPSSMAIGASSLTVIVTLSPGRTISLSAGRSIVPVTSVVRK